MMTPAAKVRDAVLVPSASTLAPCLPCLAFCLLANPEDGGPRAPSAEPIWEEDGLHDQEDDEDDEDDEEKRAFEKAAEEAMAEARRRTQLAPMEGGGGGGAASGAPPAATRTWADEAGYVAQGGEGCNDFMRTMMERSGVPANKRVLPPAELQPAQWAGNAPKLQPYQETVGFVARPTAYPNARLLVVHSTGSGKTATMIRVADNFFKDRRPKVAIFPTSAVCANFYKELQKPHFPNRYADYLGRLQRIGAATGMVELPARKALELPHILRHGRVPDEFLHAADLPSAPLRAFSYTQAGGSASCGKVGCINALFKCPDGYDGGYPRKTVPRGRSRLPGDPTQWVPNGYEDFNNAEHRHNPFSNK